MARKITTHNTTEQSTDTTNTTNMTNKGLPKMRQQIFQRTPKHLPSEKQSTQNIQKKAILQNSVDPKCPAPTIQHTTKKTKQITQDSNSKGTTNWCQNKHYKIEEYKRRRNTGHTVGDKRKNESWINMLHTRNDGRMAKPKF